MPVASLSASGAVGATRIVAPADNSIGPEGKCAPFPTGSFTLANASFAGANVNSCGAGGSCAWQQDMSYVGNVPTNYDFFLQVAPGVRPYIAHVADDGGAAAHSWTVVHSHPLKGSKFFTWGADAHGTFWQVIMIMAL
jgi:hypothetical protein